MEQAPRAVCAVCSYNACLTNHHIHPREFRESYPNGAEHINEKANLVVLCAGCHSAVHDKRPFHVITRDIKTKLRRKFKRRRGVSDEQVEQSIVDQIIQRETWRRMCVTLADKSNCRKIEEYRRILRLIARIHRNP